MYWNDQTFKGQRREKINIYYCFPEPSGQLQEEWAGSPFGLKGGAMNNKQGARRNNNPRAFLENTIGIPDFVFLDLFIGRSIPFPFVPPLRSCAFKM